EIERLAAMALGDSVAILHLDAVAANEDPRGGGQPDERIAPEALAADHRLEQEAVRRAGELGVKRERRGEGPGPFAGERYAVKSLRGQRAKFVFGHDASTLLSRVQRRFLCVACSARRGRELRAAPPAPVVSARPVCPGGVVAVESVEAHCRCGCGISLVR